MNGHRILLAWLALGSTIRAPQAQAQTPDSVPSSSQIDLGAYASNPRVQHYLDYFTGQARDRFARWLDRGRSVQSLIGSNLEREGLPKALSFLPMIESGYSNQAISRAGAVGMWQFIPETARRYGLRVDRWVDERRNPERATTAAVRHLRDLTTQFGSPYLAMAAYNAGAGSVTRGLDRLNSSAGADDSGDDHYFRLADRALLAKETRDYVPQLIAAATIGNDPERFGFNPAPAVELGDETVAISRPVALSSVARLLGVPDSTLQRLNPHLIRGITPPEGGFVKVPAGLGSTLEARLDRLPPVNPWRSVDRSGRSIRTTRSTDPDRPVHVRVRRGDTLDSIATRLNVPSEALRRTNALPRIYRLVPGQILRVP